MGVCYSGSYTQVTIQTEKTKCQNTPNKEVDNENNNNGNNIIEKDPEFEDMPEWEGDRYKGYGIKRMKGYKCDLKIDELNKKREQFWSSKKSLKNIWKIIHQACVYDYLKAEEYLSKNNITPINGCINVCKDIENNYYYIPNFCINDPFFEKTLLPIDDSKYANINITLYDGKNGKNYKVQVKENAKGIDIKNMYIQKTKIDPNLYKIRLLFGGSIIQDEEMLYQHKIKNNQCIQICISEI